MRLPRILDTLGWWPALRDGGSGRLLASNALLDATGTGLASLCLPFFLIGSLGFGKGELAVALGLLGACELLAAVPNGALAGRFGLKRALLINKIGQAVVYTVVAVAGDFNVVLISCALIGALRAGGSGLNQSLVAAAVGAQDRSGLLGSIRALRNIGYLVSGSIGGVLLATESQAALRAALITNALSYVYGAWCVRRVPVEGGAASPGERINFQVLRDVQYLALVLAAAMFGSSIVILDIGLPLWALQNPEIPRWTVAGVLCVNTAMVVILQYRVSQRVSDVTSALAGLRTSTFAFCTMAITIAVTALVSRPLAVVLMFAAAVLLTIGEMFESSSWWTISFELSPENRRSEYLAAFDLCWGIVSVLGPSLMAAVVAFGTRGWLAYGAALLIVSLAAQSIVKRRQVILERSPASAPC